MRGEESERERGKRWMHEAEDEENVPVKDSDLDISLLNDSLKSSEWRRKKG